METLKFILLIENILCVYRNYSTLGKYQNLIFFRTLFEILVQIASVIFYHKCTDHLFYDRFYYTISYISSVLIICLAMYHSKEFSEIAKQHEDINFYLLTDSIYKRKFNSRKRVVFYLLLIYNLYCFSSYAVYYAQVAVDEVFKSECPNSVYYVIQVSIYVSDCRFIVELPIISMLYSTMADQLDAVSRTLKVEINGLKRFKAEYRFDDVYYSRFNKGTMFDNWSAAYTIVEKNSKLCRDVFGFQIIASVVIMIIYYVLLLCGMVVLSIMGDFKPHLQFDFISTLLVYIAALFALSRAAQRVNNSANVLKRLLCTLLVHSLGCKKQYKATRDLLRLVCNHPVQTRGFGSIGVDMTLLPTCIAFCTTYTVTALQFNNVL